MIGFTYGCEHEWADFPLKVDLPQGCLHNTKDHTIVNSNGIANDPSGKLYHYGGEINTPPTDSIGGQVEILESLLDRIPMAKVNYRSNLHIHIRVPGLRNDLILLKRVQKYIHTNMPQALKIIEPIPRPSRWESSTHEEFEGAMRRYKRRCVSHHTLLTNKRLTHQLGAKTCDEFFKREVPHAGDGRILWHLQPRLCVSLRQMLETDTIEFRHWPGTINSDELLACFEWCRRFIVAAMDDVAVQNLLAWAKRQEFPKFLDYVHWMELRYRATVHDGTLTKDQISNNIAAIRMGRFGDSRDAFGKTK